MIKLCTPAIIYLIFSLVQIVLDTLKGLYNTAIMKSVVMIAITFLLNLLCEGGMTIISWVIVFIPFIFMTVIVAMLLYIFGLNAKTGSINYTCKNYPDNISVDNNGNIIIYDPAYNYATNPAFYDAPNIYIPKPQPQTNTYLNSQHQPIIQSNVPFVNEPPIGYSSSPAYQS